MQRTAVIAGSVVAALATGGVLAVNGGAQTPPGGQTLNLVTKDYQFKPIDVPPRQRNPENFGRGDGFVLSAVVTDAAGVRKGGLHVVCTATASGRQGRAVCHGGYILNDGDLYLTTIFRNNDEGNVDGAVTGGTGAYAGARGTFASVDRPGEKGGDPSDDTITLLP